MDCAGGTEAEERTGAFAVAAGIEAEEYTAAAWAHILPCVQYAMALGMAGVDRTLRRGSCLRNLS